MGTEKVWDVKTTINQNMISLQLESSRLGVGWKKRLHQGGTEGDHNEWTDDLCIPC